MENTPFLYTERLILRKFSTADQAAVLNIFGDPEVNTFLPMFPLKNLEEAKQYLFSHYLKYYCNPQGFRWAVCLKNVPSPIGYLHVSDDDSHDFGYGLQKEYWNQGIMTEAAHAAIQCLRHSGIPYLTATHDVNNLRSGAVMKKLGMTYCYSYQEQWQPKDILVTFRMYQLNFDPLSPVYQKYWNQYPVHFVEQLP